MSIVDPQSLNYRIHGQDSPGRPVVLIHGLMGFAANWGKIWPKLEDARPVLVFDQRGHGRSAKPLTGYSPAEYADDLKRLLDHIGWGKVHVVGHSMGGRVALRFCSLFPDRATTLTMEDSGAEARPDRLRWITDLLGSIPTPFISREAAKSFFETNFSHDPMTGSFLHANLETKPDGTLDWRFHAPGMIETVDTGRKIDALEEFRGLTLPTLLIRGSRSEEFRADEADRMRNSRPGVELRTIEGAGHYVHAEKPTEFSSALNEFLRRHDS